MRIGINTLSVTASRGGAKTYLVNLMKGLAEFDQQNDYFVFVTSANRHLFDITSPNFYIIEVGLLTEKRALRVAFEQVILPLYLWKHEIDVFFSPGNAALLFPGSKQQVMVIHGPLVVRGIRQNYAPNELGRLDVLYYNLLLPIFMRQSNKVIAVSHNFRKWLRQEVRVEESKVRVVHEGVDADFFQHTENTAIEGLPNPYILFLSTLFQYKNADRLIEAFGHLKNAYDSDRHLVIAGRDTGSQQRALQQMATDMGLAECVHFLGAVPHQQVPSLYKGADVFVYPSTVESFGLPPLEAMASGTPVIGSNRCSVPEIIGDAGLIVDPDDAHALAQALDQVIRDEALRTRLISKGFERVKLFTWQETALKTLDVLNELRHSG